jgi:hypothetical protein
MLEIRLSSCWVLLGLVVSASLILSQLLDVVQNVDAAHFEVQHQSMPDAFTAEAQPLPPVPGVIVANSEALAFRPVMHTYFCKGLRAYL